MSELTNVTLYTSMYSTKWYTLFFSSFFYLYIWENLPDKPGLHECTWKFLTCARLSHTWTFGSRSTTAQLLSHVNHTRQGTSAFFATYTSRARDASALFRTLQTCWTQVGIVQLYLETEFPPSSGEPSLKNDGIITELEVIRTRDMADQVFVTEQQEELAILGSWFVR